MINLKVGERKVFKSVIDVSHMDTVDFTVTLSDISAELIVADKDDNELFRKEPSDFDYFDTDETEKFEVRTEFSPDDLSDTGEYVGELVVGIDEAGTETWLEKNEEEIEFRIRRSLA